MKDYASKNGIVKLKLIWYKKQDKELFDYMNEQSKNKNNQNFIKFFD